MEEKIEKPDDEEILNKVTEPLEAYFQSSGFLKSKD